MRLNLGKKANSGKKDDKKGKKQEFIPRLRLDARESNFTKREVFYQFGSIAIDFNGSGRKRCELHVIADGVRLYTCDFMAVDGADFVLDRQWVMADNAHIVVTTNNRKVTLFNINVSKPNVNAAKAREVRRASGGFSIEYRVFKNSDYRNRVQYQHAMFKDSKRPSVWRNIDKTALLSDLEKTTADARNVNQEAAGFCGATAVAYALATSQPHRCIQFGQELFENGSFRGSEKSFRTSSKFRNSLVPGSQERSLSLADYLFTGTLMEDAGFKKQEYTEKMKKNKDKEWVITQDYNKEGNMSGAQKRWSREILGFHNDRGIGDKFPLGRQIKGLVECNRVLRADGYVFPALHADIFAEYASKKAIKFSNHWVTLTGIDFYDKKDRKISVIDSNVKKVDKVKPRIFTWGRDYSGIVSKEHFKKYVWVYIVSEPFTSRDLVTQLKKV